jgi:hypothetical protein
MGARLIGIADAQASRVERGSGIVPYKVGPFMLFDATVSPVQIGTADIQDPKTKGLATRVLLYLGQGGGISVFYDPKTDQVIRAPISRLLTISSECSYYLEDKESERGSLEERRRKCHSTLGNQGSSAFFDLNGVDLHNADIGTANLQRRRFMWANLRRANLMGANLEGAYLIKTDLREANLVGSILENARLQGANLTGAHLEQADLSGANLRGTILKDITFDSDTIWPKGFRP